ncbi:hypothetical protein B0H11DRAFT_1869859 [Mycena galericulata]|nr:hypothetical protein B0H11DRAFT_1869859 [Mycena galericulata]
MHQSLRIPEIVSLICEELLNGAEQDLHCLNPDTSQTLAALARTCKTFQNPALDVLWSSQTTFMNVLDCMPGEIWHWQDDPEPGEEKVVLTRPVLPVHWDRPLFYSRRVKFFTFNTSHSYPDTPAVYETLRTCLPPGPLFPNIESIEWESSDAALFSHFRLFVGPRLTRLSLGDCQSIGHLSSLPSLAAECPLLRDFSITCSKGLSGRCESVSFLVRGLNHLRTLYVPCLDTAALQHLAQLPEFDSLVLADQSPLGSSSTLPATSEELSLAWDDLDMTVTDIHAVSEILVALRQPLLFCLSVKFPRNTPANTIAECYNTVAANCDQDSLKSLSINSENPLTNMPASPVLVDPVRSQTLLPLFMFGHLTRVDLSAPVGFDLDDAAAADMAHAWPRITSLTLGAIHSMHVPSRMTLCALLSFAKFCPRLRHLELQLDATVVPKWDAQKSDEKRPRQKTLTYLDVLNSPVGTPLAVAAFLSSTFPKLRILTAGYVPRRVGEDPPFVPSHLVARREKWKAAEAALAVLGTVRTEERYWTKREVGN